MTLQGQLAQSALSAQAHAGPLFAELFLSTGGMNAGLLGNASAQVVRFSPLDVDGVVETYLRILGGPQPSVRLAVLKRQRFIPEGRLARIQASLAALNAPQPTELPLAQWKAVLEEIEDEE
jgi:hypothetical protein